MVLDRWRERERETTKATDRAAPLLDRVYLTSLPRALLSNSCGDSPSSKTFNLTFSALENSFQPGRITGKEVTLALVPLETRWSAMMNREGEISYFLPPLFQIHSTFAWIFNRLLRRNKKHNYSFLSIISNQLNSKAKHFERSKFYK